MAIATNTFAHAFIAALARMVFIVLGGFLRIGFCFTVAVAIMAFSCFGFAGLGSFLTVMRHSM